MSELKAFDVGLGQYCEDGSPCVVAFDADRNPRILSEKVYLKSEADKVITKLKEKLVEQATLRAWAELQLRRQKYKRCLAKAEECHALYDKYSMLAADDTNWEEEDYYFARWRFFEKWKYKWLELAEKFKENV